MITDNLFHVQKFWVSNLTITRLLALPKISDRPCGQSSLLLERKIFAFSQGKVARA